MHAPANQRGQMLLAEEYFASENALFTETPAAVACLQAPLLERLNLGILFPHGLLQFLVQPMNRRQRHAVRIHGGDVFGQVIASSAHQKMPHSSRKNARKSWEEHCPSSKYKS